MALEGTPRSGWLHLRLPEQWPDSAVPALPPPTYPTPISFYCSFLIPGPVCEVSLHPALMWGSGTNSLFLYSKWDPTLLGLRASGSRAVPHLLVQGQRSCSGRAGGDFAELEWRNGAGGDLKHRQTQAHSCHQPHGRKWESLLDSPDTYSEKLRTKRIFLFKTWARYLLSSLFIFKLLLRGQCGGAVAEQKGRCAGPGCSLAHSRPPESTLQSCTRVVFPVVKLSGAQRPLARRRAGPRGQGGRWDKSGQKDVENFKPLEY